MKGLVGTDLEFAVKMGDKFVPAGVLPIEGRKGNPVPVGNFGGVEIDCCAVEITPPPSDTEDGFVHNITSLLNAVKMQHQGVELLTMPSVKFERDQLMGTRFAMEMGCDPDFNVWLRKKNVRPNAVTELRTFGGHIHIEHGTPDTIKACDLTLGMWSVLADPDKDRRSMYGKAGAFRIKKYGVEYRVLSNFWCGSDDLIREAFRRTRQAQNLVESGRLEEVIAQVGGPEVIQEVINRSLESEAKRILAVVGG